MASKKLTRVGLMAELFELVNRGPDLTLDHTDLGPLTIAVDRAKARRQLREQYLLWAETWVLPRLETIRASWAPGKGKKVKRG